MKAVWSYWKNSGFNDELSFIRSIALSLELAKIQFTETELVTTIEGKELLIEKYNLPFDNIKVELDQFNDKLDPLQWAFVKIYSCQLQDESFIHIDNDFYLYGKIDEKVLKSDLFFESTIAASRYNRIIEVVKRLPNINKDILINDFKNTFVFGVIGCNNLSIIKEWYSYVYDLLFNKDNKEIWTTIDSLNKYYSNQLFEQYFLSILAQDKGLTISTIQGTEYNHLFGHLNKNNEDNIQLVKHQLFERFPQYKNLQ